MLIKPEQQQRGVAGTIMVILIFGLLMSVSTAYIKMVQTETEVQSMVDHTDRAFDAAFSGLNYAIAVAQSNRAMFENTVAATASRTYVFNPLVNQWASINAAWTSIKIDKVASIPSDWLFLNEQLSLYFINETTASPPYHFRVTSFPVASTTAGAIADPERYLIKSQGRFLTYSDDKTSVLATFSAQIIAECSINFTRKLVQLKRYRYMTFQGTDATFFKAMNY